MKFEAQYQGKTYPIELRQTGESDRRDQFEIQIHTSEGKLTLPIRILSLSQGRWTLEIDGKIEDIVVSKEHDQLLVDWRNHTFPVKIYTLKEKLRQQILSPETTGVASLSAQMPGKVVTVLAERGQAVEAGEGLVVIEAMKMQNELKSPKSGTVIRCKVQPGQTVNAGDLLFEIE